MSMNTQLHVFFLFLFLVQQNHPLFLSSMAHEIPASAKPIDFSNLRTSPPVQSHVLLYAQSRLANVLYARALSAPCAPRSHLCQRGPSGLHRPAGPEMDARLGLDVLQAL